MPFSVVAIIDQYEVVSGAVDEWAIMLRVEDSECVEEYEELYGILGANKLKMVMIRVRGGTERLTRSPDVLDDLYVADNLTRAFPALSLQG